MKKLILCLCVFSTMLTACVSKKKYTRQVAQYDTLKTNYDKVNLQLSACLDERDKQSSKMKSMESELANLKANSTTLLTQLSTLSVITTEQSESIKKSLENINAKDVYIMDLQKEMARKDSLNMALVLNLKGALKDVNDEDVQIKVEGSAVFISISDKMLFKSGSYQITPRAKEVLGKVADVIKAQPQIQFMVEGHTDNKPIATASIKDNWDLSVLRATAVVRVLQKNYGVDPTRMIAAGRSEYIPVTDNDNAEGRSINRRTRIVILPQLDQFFKLLEPKKN
ncbi:MAG TPA: OmpA family protein [Bacteroidia bacterium]|nr:OmpA family protein [Bacteroidia bacterium]